MSALGDRIVRDYPDGEDGSRVAHEHDEGPRAHPGVFVLGCGYCFFWPRPAFTSSGMIFFVSSKAITTMASGS